MFARSIIYNKQQADLPLDMRGPSNLLQKKIQFSSTMRMQDEAKSVQQHRVKQDKINALMNLEANCVNSQQQYFTTNSKGFDALILGQSD